jgi:hypothetical protein
MRIAILILVFISLLVALAWHGGRDLWAQKDSAKSKLYYVMAAALGFTLLCTMQVARSSEISTTEPPLIMAVIFVGALSYQFRLYRQQNPV